MFWGKEESNTNPLIKLCIGKLNNPKLYVEIVSDPLLFAIAIRQPSCFGLNSD